MVLAYVMTIIYILSLVFAFSWPNPLISGPKMAEIPNILSIVAAQGLENTIKVKAIDVKRRPDNSGDDYIHLLSCVLFFLTHSTPFWPRIG